MSNKSCQSLGSATLIVLCVVQATIVSAAPITWIGGNADWDASITKWNPNDEPDGDDEAIFTTPNTVNLANALETITALTMSGGIDLLLNGNDLTVNGGNVTLSGASTLLDVPTNSTLNSDDVFVNANASLRMQGGTITMAQSGGEAVLTVVVNGALGGYGTINSTDVIATADTTVVSIGGSLVVSTFDLFSQQAGTLTINVPTNGRVDLDQTGAVIDITRNDTMEINGAAHDPAVDAYSGTLSLSEGATLDMSNAWGMNTGTVNVDTRGVAVSTAGAAATIAGGELTMTGGTIDLPTDLDSLRFTAEFTATGGTISNSGLLIFDTGFSAVGPGADFQMNGAGASITVANNGTIAITQYSFDLGGAGDDTSNVTTIDGALGVFMDFDSGAGDVVDGRVELNGGILQFENIDGPFAGTDTTWHLSAGVVNANLGVNRITGEDLMIQTETINVADATLIIETTAVEITNPTITIASSGELDIDTGSRWTSSGVSVTGAGILRPGNATIEAAVTWNLATVDLDDGPLTLNDDLTINADSIDDAGDGVDSSITISDGARLTVNIGGGGHWTLDPGGSITYNGDAGVNHYLAGSDTTINGTINHTGDGRILARIDIGSTGVLNIAGAGLPLILGGGDAAHPNTIAGGTIDGPGYLVTDFDTALIGSGTIDADLGMHGSLKADNGTLNINGEIYGFDGGILGTADSDGILDVSNAWNTDLTSGVELQGGKLRGATITNDGTNGISGYGLLAAPVINNTRIDAEGGTLVLDSPANTMDLDGTADSGVLNALLGNLEIREGDVTFQGTLNIGAGRSIHVDADYLRLRDDTGPGMTHLVGGTISTTGAVYFYGTLLVDTAPSVIVTNVPDPNLYVIFRAGSHTTINTDLALQQDLGARINVGATLTGTGRLINTANKYLYIDEGVDVNVQLRNEGNLSLSANTPGAVNAYKFEQTDSGTFYFEIFGPDAADADLLTIDTTATLDGTLQMWRSIAVGDPYEPVAGDSWEILRASGGIIGQFDNVTTWPTPLADGLFWYIEYDTLGNRVVAHVLEFLDADFDEDGDVDGDDLTRWQAGYGAGTQHSQGDADGDGDVDGRDFLTWQRQYGSGLLVANVSVPEPSGFVPLAMIGFAFLFQCFPPRSR